MSWPRAQWNTQDKGSAFTLSLVPAGPDRSRRWNHSTRSLCPAPSWLNTCSVAQLSCGPVLKRRSTLLCVPTCHLFGCADTPEHELLGGLASVLLDRVHHAGPDNQRDDQPCFTYQHLVSLVAQTHLAVQFDGLSRERSSAVSRSSESVT